MGPNAFPSAHRIVMGLLLLIIVTISPNSPRAAESKPANPCFRHGAYAGQSVELSNNHLRLVMFKRLSGWAWGELYTPTGKCMAVLEHLGEIMLRDQDIPMRLEADSVYTTTSPEGKSLVFNVRSLVVRDKLKGTSFENWMRYPLEQPCLVGRVILTLSPSEPLISMQYRFESTANYYARYIRGPWLRVGEGSFGIRKDDAMLPGVEWLVGDEWSSGSDWFKSPWSERFVPHPNKVSAPLMALSYEGDGIGLAWQPERTVTRWFNYRDQRPQPVFAAPNFIDRMNNSLMGLMIPDASMEGQENKVYADIPVELRIGQRVDFDAELWLSKGNSLSVMTDWVKRHGLPEPSRPKWPFPETLDRIANAYNTNFWHEGMGFGIEQPKGRPGQIGPHVPAFLERYTREHADTKLGKELKRKIDWCRAQRKEEKPSPEASRKALLEQGDALLKLQRPDGSYSFDPKGRHYVKDDFLVATSFIEPMGHAGDTALDLCMTPVPTLLDIAEETGKPEYREAARKALEYCMPMTRPEGGDFWETPLHAPNLLAAGHAAIAYYRGYKAFGEERYKEKAVYWIRSVLPFTHLWETAEVPMLYNTKPCLCSSDWYFANWVRDHVQWEVLLVFNSSASQGIFWEEVDPEIDWKRYFTGITAAVTRWIHTREDETWKPHNIPETLDSFKSGDYDYCFADTHNSTTGNYGGMFIMPVLVAENIYSIMDRNKR